MKGIHTMSEISKYEQQKKKLQGICDENEFTFRFIKNQYPITLIVRPVSDVGTQMSMLGSADEGGYCSPDSYMMWYFKDGEMHTKVHGTFTIDKNLRSKIENILVKMTTYWQQYFFRDLVENDRLTLGGVKMPDVPEDDKKEQHTPPEEKPSPEENPPASEAAKVLALIDASGVTQAYVASRLNIGLSRALELLDELERRELIEFANGRYYLAKMKAEEE